MLQSTPNEQKILEQAPTTLLYAAAKPSAPAVLVEQVKSGDITTHKQYQELLAELEQVKHEAELDRKERNAVNKELGRLKETEKQLEGARQALAAAKMRGDKWQAEAEARKDPIVTQVVDDDAVARLAMEKAEQLTAEVRGQLKTANNNIESLKQTNSSLSAQLKNAQEHRGSMPEPDEDEQHNAYDAAILACRTWDNTWQALRPQLSKLPKEQRAGAREMMLQRLMSIKEELLQCL